MKTSINGLILKEMTVSDNDRIVTVLTKEKGIISCYVRRAKHIKSRNFAPTNLLTFSRMNIYNGRGMYIIDEADVIMRFFDVDPDIKRFALSQYFSELVIKSVPQEVESDGQLELMLNCLHLLSNTLRPCDIIKTVFEIRLAVLSGSTPNILFCDECGCYEADRMYFDYNKNKLLCSGCCRGGDCLSELSVGAVRAMRYIIVSDPKKIFSFHISESALKQLYDCSENYIISMFEYRPKTLQYYDSIRKLF